MKIKLIIISIIFALNLHAQDSLNVTKLSEIEISELAVPIRVVYSNNYVYVSGINEPQGFAVVNVSTPMSPQLMSISYEGDLLDIFGNYALVRTDYTGICLGTFDVSDPFNPTFLVPVDISFYRVSDIKCSGNFGYVVGEEEGLIIIDLSDPLNPVEVSRIDLTTLPCTSLAIYDEIAFVGTNSGDLYIIDVNDPAVPVELMCYETYQGTAIEKISVSNGIAYLSIEQLGIEIVNVSDPSLPYYVNLLGPQYATVDQKATNTHLFNASIAEGLRIYDTSDLQDLNLVGFYSTPYEEWALAVNNNIVYVATVNWGGINSPLLYIFDCGAALAIEPDKAKQTPTNFKMSPPYPNPFNPTTTITFNLPVASEISFDVYDLTGSRVGIGHEPTRYSVGNHSITFDGSELSSGIYFYCLTAGEYSAVGNMVLLK